MNTNPAVDQGAGLEVVSLGFAARASDEPWTLAQEQRIESELGAEVARLTAEILAAQSEHEGLLRDAGDGAGGDLADAGAKSLELEQEVSLVNNSREMLDQSRRALARIAAGCYGSCEACREPIGKMRLIAFPRATLCVSCKQHQERR